MSGPTQPGTIQRDLGGSVTDWWNGTSAQFPTASDISKYLQISQDGSSFQINAFGGINLLIGAAAGLQALRVWADFIQEESVYGQTAPGGTDYQIRWVNPPNPDQVFRCARIGAIGKPEVAGDPAAPMCLELGENSSGPLTTQVVARGLWIDDILFADDQDHTFEIEEARAGGNQQGKGFRLFAGPGYTGGGANVGGSITISGGPGAGGGTNGAVDINTLVTSGATTLGRAGSASATVMLAGTTTAPDVILPVGGDFVINGNHNGITGSVFPKLTATDSLGTPDLNWRRAHVWGGSGDGVRIYDTGGQLMSSERTSSVLGTAWHLQSGTGSIALFSATTAIVAGGTATISYAATIGGFVSMRDFSGTDVVRVEGAGNALGLHGATPTPRQSPSGDATVGTAGVGSAVLYDTTFTGGLGSTAYTLFNLVHALKTKGLIDQ